MPSHSSGPGIVPIYGGGANRKSRAAGFCRSRWRILRNGSKRVLLSNRSRATQEAVARLINCTGLGVALMSEWKLEPFAHNLGRLVASATKSARAAAKDLEPHHIRWGIVVVWLAFLLAFLASDFFVVAHNAGIYAAIEAAAVLGPTRAITDTSLCYPTSYSGCASTTYEPSFSISIKLLLGLTAVVSVGLWLWAAQRQRQSSPT
jgi:hypothetical protein